MPCKIYDDAVSLCTHRIDIDGPFSSRAAAAAAFVLAHELNGRTDHEYAPMYHRSEFQHSSGQSSRPAVAMILRARNFS